MPENAAYEGFRKATEALTDALTVRLTGLTEQTEAVLRKLEGQARRTGKWIVVLCVTLALSLGGLGVVGYTVIQVKNNDRQIQHIQRRLSHRSQVLCPLYTVFVQSDTPAAAKATPPNQKAQRDHALSVIRKGYMDLGCLPHLDRNGHLPPLMIGKEAPPHS